MGTGRDATNERPRVGGQRGSGAMRQRAAGLLDARLVGGIALVCVSVTAGALLLGRDEETVTVWRAPHDLAVGASITDAVPVELPRSTVSELYVSSPDGLTGVLRRPVAAGELLPRSAVASSDTESTRFVTVPVDPLHAPPGLLAGEAVDVWASADAQSTQPPRLVLPGVLVAAVSADDTGLSGQLGVVLAVPEAQVASVVAAARAGVVDLVAVPVDGLSGEGSTT